MTLMKRTQSDYPSLTNFFDNFFGNSLMDWSNMNFSDTNTTLPAVNVRETDDAYEIDVAAPGMDKKDFNIHIDNDVLTISSEKNEAKNEKYGRYSRREFSYQSFQRSFNVPSHIVDGNEIKAQYHDGILSISLPKKEEAKPRPPKEIKIS